jgi:hypothetical protein
MTKNNIELQFQDLFDCPDDDAVDDEPQHFLEKVFADAELSVIGVNPEGLNKEIASIDKRATAIYKKIAASQAKPAPSASLEKRATNEKILRIEETHYPASGKVICAEIGTSGEVVRVYEKVKS